MHWKARRSGSTPKPDDMRTAFDVDYARVVHSASFRRLQGKTQILNLGDSDFYRTRLTHSLEVGQIAGSILGELKKAPRFNKHCATDHLPDLSLIQAIGFTHDLGHPPFGHGGEVALNYCMRDNGGFEGNGQTLRILSKLEKFSERDGADLTRRTLLGVLKYPAPFRRTFIKENRPCLLEKPTSVKIIDPKKSKPPKCFLDTEQDVVNWILDPLNADDRQTFGEIVASDDGHYKPKHKSFDCSIMDVADDIAYGVHDLEDAIALELISEKDFRESVRAEHCPAFLESLKEEYSHKVRDDAYNTFVQSLFVDADSRNRKKFIGSLVHHFVTNLDIVTSETFSEPLLRHKVELPREYSNFLHELKKLISEKVIKSPNVKHLEFKGQQMVVSVFEALQSHPRSLLPPDALERYEKSGENIRAIGDYVAGMTDGFLVKTYDRLFSPRMGSVFDKL